MIERAARARSARRFPTALAAMAALLLAATPMMTMAQANPAADQVRSSVEQGVTVKVTPKAIGGPDGRWEFTVVFDTHSADLRDDLTRISLLVTDDGRTLKPATWTGAGPGGHHREGVLAFDVPPPKPAAVELKIARPDEPSPRIFRWQL